jgi:hypothetical protein
MQSLSAARQLLYNRQLFDSSCLVAVRAALRSRPGLQIVMSTLSSSLSVGRRTGVFGTVQIPDSHVVQLLLLQANNHLLLRSS